MACTRICNPLRNLSANPPRWGFCYIFPASGASEKTLSGKISDIPVLCMFRSGGVFEAIPRPCADANTPAMSAITPANDDTGTTATS